MDDSLPYEREKRILSRLTDGIASYSGGTGGGVPELLPGDIAAALSGTDRAAYLLALKKWTLNERVEVELFYAIMGKVEKMATLDQWWPKHKHDEQPPGFIRKITKLALVECLSPRRCSLCNGAQITHDQRPCAACGGRGWWRLTNEKRAHVMGVHWRTWYRRWNGRYRDVVNLIDTLDDDALRRVRIHLGGV